MLALSAPPDDTPAPTPALTIHTEASAQRHAVEAFIATVYRERFGEHIPLVRREHVRGFITPKPIWQLPELNLDQVRQQAEAYGG